MVKYYMPFNLSFCIIFILFCFKLQFILFTSTLLVVLLSFSVSFSISFTACCFTFDFSSEIIPSVANMYAHNSLENLKTILTTLNHLTYYILLSLNIIYFGFQLTHFFNVTLHFMYTSLLYRFVYIFLLYFTQFRYLK